MMAECARRLRFPGILAGRPPGFEHEKKASFDPSRMPRPASRAEEYHKPNCRGRRPRNGAARTLAARSALFHAAQDGVRGRGPPCRPPQSTWKQQQLPGKNPFALSSPRSGRVEGFSCHQQRFPGSASPLAGIRRAACAAGRPAQAVGDRGPGRCARKLLDDDQVCCRLIELA